MTEEEFENYAKWEDNYDCEYVYDLDVDEDIASWIDEDWDWF